jgi:hypothetical protein
MSNQLELPFGAPPGKVQDPSQSPEDGHEQSPTSSLVLIVATNNHQHLDAPLSLVLIVVTHEANISVRQPRPDAPPAHLVTLLH